MAEKPGELRSVDKLDPVSTVAGAGSDESLERYSDDASDTYQGSDSKLDRGDFNAGSDSDVAEETEQIKAQIEETRSQMGETIDAIQERLSFSNISDQVSETVSNAIESAKDTAYDATIGKAVNFMKNVGDGFSDSGALKTVRDNPLPFALIGIGTGLLVYQGYARKASRTGSGPYARKLSDGRDFGSGRGELNVGTGSRSGIADGITDKASAALASVGNAAGSAYDSVTGKVSNVAGSAYDSVTGKVSDAYSEAGDMANKAYERVGEYGTIAHEKYDQYLEENPLALGAVAVAVGAAVGFAIPSTRFEGRVMGEARETVMQRAHEAAGTLVDKAKNVAAEAGQTIKDEARALTE